MTEAITKSMRKGIFFLFLIAWFAAGAQDVYKVDLNDARIKVPNTIWGIFFEDINRSADGGLYAELIRNRSFDFPQPMTGWTTLPERVRDGIFEITDDMDPQTHDPKYMSVHLHPRDTVGLVNDGFGGIDFKKNALYNFTLRYRQISPGVRIRVVLLDNSNHQIGSGSMDLASADGNWQEQHLQIISTNSASTGKVLVLFEGAGKLDVDRISLFPSDTWKHQPGGLRNDLVQRIADLHPGFFRFPGGCVVEGNQLLNRYQWKNTIGSLQNRLLVPSIWADNIPERPLPGYMESFGLGFLEYFELCEDIGAAPLPIINAGMSCQFDAAEVVAIAQIKPFIQDALDLIEFANGDTTTRWGKKRAAFGHPALFNMTMLGVGNENWGPQYIERLKLFTKAIKEKYPTIQLICATGYSPSPTFHYMDSSLRSMHADILDEHFYMSPQWFMQNSNRYDHYDRNGPKIFVGEYAAQSKGVGSQQNVNNLLTALSEACFMTGIERNADVVCMASYAPLFAHVTDWQWTPDLIWFDNRTSYNTPNYYVQQLFSLNKGTNVVPILLNGQTIQGQDSIWASSVIDRNTNEVIIKLVNPSSTSKEKIITMPGLKRADAMGNMIMLKGNPNDVNGLEKEVIHPISSSIEIKKGILKLEISPWSFEVLRVKM